MRLGRRGRVRRERDGRREMDMADGEGGEVAEAEVGTIRGILLHLIPHARSLPRAGRRRRRKDGDLDSGLEFLGVLQRGIWRGIEVNDSRKCLLQDQVGLAAVIVVITLGVLALAKDLVRGLVRALDHHPDMKARDLAQHLDDEELTVMKNYSTDIRSTQISQLVIDDVFLVSQLFLALCRVYN